MLSMQFGESFVLLSLINTLEYSDTNCSAIHTSPTVEISNYELIYFKCEKRKFNISGLQSARGIFQFSIWQDTGETRSLPF